MSCPGDNYVVPGANPCNVASSTIIVSDKNSSSTNLVITATTQATAQTLTSVTLTTDYTSNISIWGNFTITTNTNTINNITYYVIASRNGTTFSPIGETYKSSLGGSGHFLSCPLLAGTTNSAAGNITFYLKAYASAASVFTVNPAQILAIGNISQD